jgi:hypothetical protein
MLLKLTFGRPGLVQRVQQKSSSELIYSCLLHLKISENFYAVLFGTKKEIAKQIDKVGARLSAIG